MAARRVTQLGPVSDNGIGNGAEAVLDLSLPYTVEVTIEGVADLLFHRWDCDAVESKAKAAKNSAAKKTDNLDSYVYRDDTGAICLPGEYLRQAIVNAAKYRQDPRSPRKSAMDLYKAAIVSLTPLAPLGVKTWEYEHRCRVTVQRNGITRTRPAMKAGWRATMVFMVNLPEYVSSHDLQDVLSQAGRLIGVGDFRPTYGRFFVAQYAVLEE